jgi:hypothetical protein
METGLSVHLKWPNDLLIAGRKLGGVLAELSIMGDRLEWAVVGLGLNINLDFAADGMADLAGQATSLSLELGRGLWAGHGYCRPSSYAPSRIWRRSIVALPFTMHGMSGLTTWARR